MSQVQQLKSKPRIVNIAGLVIEFGSTSVEGGVLKQAGISVTKEGADLLFNIEQLTSNDMVSLTQANKYNTVADVVRLLHRQVYLNAYEPCVHSYVTDREDTLKQLLVAAGLLGINVWTYLNNPNESVKGAFIYDDETIQFERRVVGSNFVTDFEQVTDITRMFGNHEVVFNGTPIDTSGMPKSPNFFIGSVTDSSKITVVVNGSMYSPGTQPEFRAASVGGGVMLLPQEMYTIVVESSGIPDPSVGESIDDNLEDYLVVAQHEATPEMLGALEAFNNMKPEIDNGEHPCGCGGDCANCGEDADDENYALPGEVDEQRTGEADH